MPERVSADILPTGRRTELNMIPLTLPVMILFVALLAYGPSRPLIRPDSVRTFPASACTC